jgi:probable HAF family extracellular repeat protein
MASIRIMNPDTRFTTMHLPNHPAISRRPKGFAPSPLALRIALALGVSFAATAHAADGIFDLGAPNGGIGSFAYGVSADGTVVAGYTTDPVTGDRAFRWTQAGGMVSLGTLNGGGGSYANAISADGGTIVGDADDGAAGFSTRAFRWTQAGGMVSLGVLNGGLNSSAYGVSADGSVVVGVAKDGAAGNANRAFRWTQAGGMASLGMLAGGTYSWASAVSADGGVVVGEADDGAIWSRAFRWTQAGGMASLGVLNGGNYSYAKGVSGDGSVVVGYADDGAALTDRAFRWTQAGGMVSLGTLNGGTFSQALGVSADGTVVVGYGDDNAFNNRAFRWTQAAGMQTVEDWLRAAGVSVPVDITDKAYATNSDGSVVVGRLANNFAFIARVAPVGGGGGGGGTGGSGLVTLADVQQSLAGTATGGAMALTSGGLLINGAHSRPLSRRVAEGQKTFWVAGDWGTDDHGSRSGDIGLAEAGLGHNFGPVQINLSLGQTWAKQNQVLNGSTRTDGTYLLAEALVPVQGNLWATLGGYGHWGKADLKRGYLNAGVQDFSTANPNVDTWGLRARLDWGKAFQAADASFGPYADITYSEARLAAYTETGGGFPARFDARTEKATELRLGVNADNPLANGMNLFGTLEAAHRFEKSGARTSGELVGLFGFDLAGQNNNQDWLRAGAGVEGNLADGTASLSLNLTTRGAAPNAWLAAGWRRAF